MATYFEQEINTMNRFITVVDRANINHAESILQYFIGVFKIRDPVFAKLFTGFSMAGKTHNYIDIISFYF